MERFVRRFIRAGAAAAAASALLLAVTSAAQADGALALGKCSAWGWSSSESLRGADQKAIADCAQHDAAGCKVVATTHEGCMAVATDQSLSCGKYYWASEATRQEAEAGSLGQCRSGDGKTCTLVASKCDRDD
jgi:hypothetical protein